MRNNSGILAVSDRKYYRSIISYFDWRCSSIAGDSKGNYSAAESLEWSGVEEDYLVPFSNWNRLFNPYSKMTNKPIVMKESISYRSVQLLSQQVLQLEVLVEVGKITFSLSVKSCELLFLQFFLYRCMVAEWDVEYSLTTYVFCAQRAFNKRQRWWAQKGKPRRYCESWYCARILC